MLALIIRYFHDFFKSNFSDYNPSIFSPLGTLAKETLNFVDEFTMSFYFFFLLCPYSLFCILGESQLTDKKSLGKVKKFGIWETYNNI